MTKNNDFDYEKAQRELTKAANELRKLQGKREIPILDNTEPAEPPHCSFCNKGKNQVFRMFEGPSEVYICNECVVMLYEIVEAGGG